MQDLQDIRQSRSTSQNFKQRVQSVDMRDVQRSWHQLRVHELPTLLHLSEIISQTKTRQEALEVLRKVGLGCLWKLKLALLVVAGVWTDEMAPQIEETTQQYYSWTRDPKLLHEDGGGSGWHDAVDGLDACTAAY